MAYLIETYDKRDSQELRRENSPAHLAYLDAHKHLLLACGAKRSDDFTLAYGSIYLLDVETRGEAEAFIAADPFTAANLFERVEIVRWNKAYVAGECLLPRAPH